MPVFSVPAADVWNADDWEFLLVTIWLLCFFINFGKKQSK